MLMILINNGNYTKPLRSSPTAGAGGSRGYFPSSGTCQRKSLSVRITM